MNYSCFHYLYFSLRAKPPIHGDTAITISRYPINILNSCPIPLKIIPEFDASIPKIKRGENHNPETHLIPSFIQCVLKNKFLKINGKNHKTKDGTCVRDYIHIKDICSAIKNSLKVIKNKKKVINIGTNKGFSILEVIEKLSKVIKKKVKFTYRKKRKGDSPFLVSDFKKSKKILRWKPINSNLNKIIKDEILWQKINLN